MAPLCPRSAGLGDCATPGDGGMQLEMLCGVPVRQPQLGDMRVGKGVLERSTQLGIPDGSACEQFETHETRRARQTAYKGSKRLRHMYATQHESGKARKRQCRRKRLPLADAQQSALQPIWIRGFTRSLLCQKVFCDVRLTPVDRMCQQRTAVPVALLRIHAGEQHQVLHDLKVALDACDLRRCSPVKVAHACVRACVLAQKAHDVKSVAETSNIERTFVRSVACSEAVLLNECCNA